MNLWGVAVVKLDGHPDHKGPDHAPCAFQKILAILRKTLNVFSYDAVWVEHRSRSQGTRLTIHQDEHLVLGLPWPNIEPITFSYRKDTPHVMPRTRTGLKLPRQLYNQDLGKFRQFL